MSEDNNTVVTLKVRVTPEFREKIVETAKRNNRSMNQEIVSRLEESFSPAPKEDALMWKGEAEALLEELNALLAQNRHR